MGTTSTAIEDNLQIGLVDLEANQFDGVGFYNDVSEQVPTMVLAFSRQVT